MKITDYESLHYVIFFILSLLIISCQMFSLVFSSQTNEICVLPLGQWFLKCGPQPPWEGEQLVGWGGGDICGKLSSKTELIVVLKISQIV
jgi:hypothetical protein